MRAIYGLMLAVVLLLLVAGLALAAGDVQRPRELLGSGASDSAAEGVSLRASLGQPLAGVVSGGGTSLGHGFWGGSAPGGATYRIYLPLTVRNGP